MINAVAIISIAFWAVALVWVTRLEKKACACSQDWRRDYMKYYFIAAILYQFLLLSKNAKFLNIVAPIMALASVVYLYAIVTYVVHQKKRACHCSESSERMILFVFSLLQIATIAFATTKMIAA
jgi:hypothetical protein